MNKINWIQVAKICEQFNITEDEYFEIKDWQAENKLKER